MEISAATLMVASRSSGRTAARDVDEAFVRNPKRSNRMRIARW